MTNVLDEFFTNVVLRSCLQSIAHACCGHRGATRSSSLCTAVSMATIGHMTPVSLTVLISIAAPVSNANFRLPCKIGLFVDRLHGDNSIYDRRLDGSNDVAGGNEKPNNGS